MSAAPEEEPAAGGVLLLYLPVPLHQQDGTFWVEAQAINGLRLWAENFPQVIAMMPLSPDPPPAGWAPVSDHAEALARVRLEPLTMAYRPDRFLRAIPRVAPRLRRLIDEADYLSFAIGGLFGDWGSVGAMIAARQGRRFAIWTDRVESHVVLQASDRPGWKRRLRAALMERAERAVIRRAALGLFHGRETFDHYAADCANPRIVHNIHLSAADQIGAAALADKRAEVLSGAPLRVFYAGRAAAMKGPLDWVEALSRLRAGGVEFTARWLGDGPQLAQMQDRIAAEGLADVVETPGFVADRAAVLAGYRDAHLFLFCHKTPESPRCLLESLASGTPIIGYDGAFARDLIAGQGGGALVARDDIAALAGELARLDADRPALADLMTRAAADGAPFNDVAVFRHRSDLIKTYLSPGPAGRQPEG